MKRALKKEEIWKTENQPPCDPVSDPLFSVDNSGMPPSAESQQPQAWPARIYRHLRESADIRESVDFGVASNTHFDIILFLFLSKWSLISFPSICTLK